MFQFNIELGLKPVAGYPCLFIRITALEGQMFVIVMGIFVNDLLVTENSVAEITLVRDRMKEIFILTDQGRLEYYPGVKYQDLMKTHYYFIKQPM